MTALTARAASMLGSLPPYLVDEPLIVRIVQAQANEIDKLDALVDKLKVELQPGAATGDLSAGSVHSTMGPSNRGNPALRAIGAREGTSTHIRDGAAPRGRTAPQRRRGGVG